MATGTNYPKIGKKIWWLMRDRFKKTVPSVVTPTFVASLSSMTEASARANVISPLKELGLLDDQNKPTDLAQRWRHNEDYAKVCHEIREAKYPNELVEAYPDADPGQKESIKNWFMRSAQVGEAAAIKYADTYILLSQADPEKAEERPKAQHRPARSKSTEQSTQRQQPRSRKEPPPGAAIHPQSAQKQPPGTHTHLPAIHIDVQVHISPDTTPEQIERIFESMAKHLSPFTAK